MMKDHKTAWTSKSKSSATASTTTCKHPCIPPTRREELLSDIVVANAKRKEGTQRRIHRYSPEISSDKITSADKDDVGEEEEAGSMDRTNNGFSWWPLQDASDAIKGDKRIMIEAVQRDWRALRYATNHIKADKDVVMEAVRHDGRAILWAPDKFRNDKDVVMETVRQNGNCLRFASPSLRSDKEFVIAAVANKPESLKFALNNLNQDRDCLIAAGLWDESYDKMKIHDDRRRRSSILVEDASSSSSSLDGLLTSNPDTFVKKIVLSTRFALNEDSTPTATQFTILLKEHPYFTRSAGGAEREMNDNHDDDDDDNDNNNSQNEFTIYSPNAFSKATCDPNWTDISWPCRGTYQSCRLAPDLKTNAPQQPPPPPSCCWRYSFRYHLEEAKQTNGFMIQIVELRQSGTMSYKYKHEVGKGQEIERIMAKEVGIKMFVVYQPMNIQHKYREHFGEDDIVLLVNAIKDWYYHKCVDMTLSHIGEPIL